MSEEKQMFYAGYDQGQKDLSESVHNTLDKVAKQCPYALGTTEYLAFKSALILLRSEIILDKKEELP